MCVVDVCRTGVGRGSKLHSICVPQPHNDGRKNLDYINDNAGIARLLPLFTLLLLTTLLTHPNLMTN